MTLSRTCTGSLALGLLWLASSTSLASQEQGRGPAATPAQPAPARPTQPASERLALQVALDRAGFSPGAIDGAAGRITRTALQHFQEARGLTSSGELDDATRQALPSEPALLDYTLTAEDVAGPWRPIPSDMMEKRTLEALAYTSPLERLAERFHASPRLITRLNPAVRWEAGTVVRVPNVGPFEPPTRTETRKVNPPEADAVADVRVSKSSGTLTIRGSDGRLLFSAPVTSGSEHDPLPLGTWKVTAVYLRPVFHYNPALFWDADPTHAKARLAAGPNNPVGLVWIDLDKEHYGLHGTPEPERIGRTSSHGCVRLTNWDAMRVAALVKTGTPVLFEP
ncbi:peptidoglycan-binding protein [Luteitalea sp. TBR-22]|uniref:L,D-transpeptidase family protein n=1 Tax=Luteitalea sp. TBR-22 TaxID=2802971 RepID=UPI001EF61122|nr:L,D-transpeptidase family protein [Luteitalea sp. TBR-22]BCS34334.2 peptidoglycan-binding protein [Luteitalea sp. TBR-22]